MDDYEMEEDPCPNGHYAMRARRCHMPECDDGMIDLYDEDPLWYDRDDTEPCFECGGTGIERWCAECGWNNAGLKLADSDPAT